MPASGPRTSEQQERYIKLFYARAFNITGDQMAIAIGQDVHAAPDEAAYEEMKGRLNNMWWRMRSKTFGPTAYLTVLVQHTVELLNFKVIVWDLAREARMRQYGPEKETAVEKEERLRTRKLYNDAVDEHLERLSSSRATVIAEAQKALDALQDKDRRKPASARELKAAKAALAHAKDDNEDCEPEIRDDNFAKGVGIPGRHTLYAEKDFLVRQRLWERVWNLDIGAAMLWEVRDPIDIPATLANNEEYYKAVFVVFATDTWRFCGRVPVENKGFSRESLLADHNDANIKREGKKFRDSHIYPNMADVRTVFFDDQEGLDLLRLPAGSEFKASKRKPRDENHYLLSGFSFGTKKTKI
jgi:hypothetical protein